MSSDLATKVREIRQKLEQLDLERSTLQAELDEIIEAAGVVPERRRGRPRTRTQSGKRPIRPNSTMFWAEKVLRHSPGRPIYIDDIISGIRELSGNTVQKPSLVSSLSRYIKRNDTFVGMGEGFYGLKEFFEEAVAK